MKRLSAAVLTTALVWPWAAAHANAQAVEYAAGGLVFKESPTISMVHEDLYVSTREIRVSYVFRSVAPAAQQLRLAFPMPPYPTDTNTPEPLIQSQRGSIVHADDIDPLRRADIHAYNYMHFAVSVNGLPLAAHSTGRAVLNGKDVTRTLIDAGAPLIFDEDAEQQLSTLSPAVLAQLIAEGLITAQGSPSPEWSYQTIFEWEQTFAPGDTSVEISYLPLVGDYDVITEDTIKKYCIDAGIQQALTKPGSEAYEYSTLGYILTTAKGWKGPIGQFRLTVEKPSPNDMVAFCPVGAKKTSPTRFEWKARDFVPDHELDVMFFRRYNQ